MFCKLIGRLFSQANNRKKPRRTDAHHETAKALRLFRDTLRALVAVDQTRADALDSRAVQHLRQKRRIISNDMFTHVSPLSWEHINLTGIYTWDEPPSFADSCFRPLRTSTAIAQAA
jgi:hypothetical protein